jgi:hypothetical protein
MREFKPLTSITFQPARVLVVKLKVLVVKLKVLVVRQFFHEKIDSDKFMSDRCCSPLKSGVDTL